MKSRKVQILCNDILKTIYYDQAIITNENTCVIMYVY